MKTATEIISKDLLLRKQRHILIQKKAEELFRIYSYSMNAQGSDYCVNFEYLNTRSRIAWLKVAESIVNNTAEIECHNQTGLGVLDFAQQLLDDLYVKQNSS